MILKNFILNILPKIFILMNQIKIRYNTINQTLYTCLRTGLQLMAPVMPFFVKNIMNVYQNRIMKTIHQLLFA